MFLMHIKFILSDLKSFEINNMLFVWYFRECIFLISLSVDSFNYFRHCARVVYITKI